MTVFPDWQKHAVHQKRRDSGCIPTGFEMILRAAGRTDIDFETFQDDFDLDKDRKPTDAPKNSFGSVAAEIEKVHEDVHFRMKVFPKGQGEAKVRFIEKHVQTKRPILVSLSQPVGTKVYCHIMPVVDVDDENVYLLREMRADGTPDIQVVSKKALAETHDTVAGGEDVAYLDETEGSE